MQYRTKLLIVVCVFFVACGDDFTSDYYGTPVKDAGADSYDSSTPPADTGNQDVLADVAIEVETDSNVPPDATMDAADAANDVPPVPDAAPDAAPEAAPDAPQPEACSPTTCQAQGATCGSIADGCGGTLSCGSCTPPETCGGGGTPNVCGQSVCVPKTCSELGKNCGWVDDGCGTQLNCGSCPTNQTCGGGGTPNVCGGCVPITCSSIPQYCGLLEDGCGNTIDCGPYTVIYPHGDCSGTRPYLWFCTSTQDYAPPPFETGCIHPPNTWPSTYCCTQGE